MSVYVIVDDSDSGLDYFPVAGSGDGGYVHGNPEVRAKGWFVGGTGRSPEFRTTTSTSGLVSSTTSYTFNGSSIWVFGSISNVYAITNVSFSIDDEVLGAGSYYALTGPRSHVPFFSYLSSSFTMHTLTIEINGTDASNTTNPDFFIDYLVYEATLNSSLPTAEDTTSWVFIDDTSPYLTTSEGWSRTGALPNFTPPDTGGNLTDATLNSTVLAPTVSGATITLNFTGASTVEAYAMLLEDVSSLGTYIVDQENSSSLGGTSWPPSQYPQYLFQILEVAVTDVDSPHTLTITASNENAFFLDYFLLKTDSAYVTSASTFLDSSTPHSSPSPTSSTTLAPKRHTNTSRIAGAVAGSIVGLAVVVLVLFGFLRRRYNIHNVRQSERQMDLGGEDANPMVHEQEQRHGLSAGSYESSNYTTSPTPFLSTSSGNNASRFDSQSRKTGAFTRTSSVPVTSSFPMSQNLNRPVDESSSATAGRSVAGPSLVPLVLESDSGLRGSALAERLPPAYTPE